MKVLLVSPAYSDIYGSFSRAKQATSGSPPPLGLLYIAATLELDGHEVQVIDAEVEHLSVDDIAERVLDFWPDVVGLYTNTPTVDRQARLATLIKQGRRHKPIVIMGGPHASALPSDTLMMSPWTDFIVKGEGETTLRVLLSVLAGKVQMEFEQIDGLCFFKRAVFRENSPRLQLNLDCLPLPARHLLNQSLYQANSVHGERGAFATVQTTRGCPFGCVFCYPVMGRQVRYRSVEKVIAEFRHLKESGVKVVGLVDDTWNVDIARAKRLCDLLADAHLGIQWGCSSRVWPVDAKLFQKMKAAGCVRVNFGVESGDPDILKAIHKGITRSQAKVAFHLAHQAGLETVGYFIIGHPFETRESIKRTIAFAKELDPDVAEFSIMTPFPGTELAAMVARGEGGIEIIDQDWSHYAHYKGAVIQVKSGDFSNMLSPEDLEHWQRQAFKEFYTRPSYLWRRLWKPREWLPMVKSGIGLLKGG